MRHKIAGWILAALGVAIVALALSSPAWAHSRVDYQHIGQATLTGAALEGIGLSIPSEATVVVDWSYSDNNSSKENSLDHVSKILHSGWIFLAFPGAVILAGGIYFLAPEGREEKCDA